MRNINSLITVLALALAPVSLVACAASGDEDTVSDNESSATAARRRVNSTAENPW